VLWQWLTTAAVLSAFAACLYMWSNAELLPERWHRLFRLGAWGAIIGAPLGVGAPLLLHAGARPWWELPALTGPALRLGLFVGAAAGATVACMLARMRLRDALRMAAACLSPYVVGLCLAAYLGGCVYCFLMVDVWDAPELYRECAQQKLAAVYLSLGMVGGTLFSLAFTGRVWRIWGAALPEDPGVLAWPPLEPEPEEGKARV